MTSTTTNTAIAENRPSIFASIGTFFSAYAHAASRRDQIDALQALSDDELAARGLAREDIVAHVFADKLYL